MTAPAQIVLTRLLRQYAAWANLTDYSEFFWNPTTAAMYQAHLVSMTGRVNTVNGLAYKVHASSLLCANAQLRPS